MRARGLVERLESRGPLGAGFLHAVCGDKLLWQQRLEALQMIIGMLELGLQAGDLRVGRNRIHFPAGDLGRRGVELGLGPGHAGHSRSSAVLQAIDLFTGEGQRRPGALQGDLVRSRVDQEEKVALLHLLVIVHRELDDVTADLRGDANKVGANRGIFRLRPYLPLE